MGQLENLLTRMANRHAQPAFAARPTVAQVGCALCTDLRPFAISRDISCIAAAAVVIALAILLPSAAFANAEPPTSAQNQSAAAVTSAPSITTQPTNQHVAAGQRATFVVVATGGASLTYQWMANGVAIGGATSPSYTTPPVTPSGSGTRFSVLVANAAGSITSSEATLTVDADAAAGQSSTVATTTPTTLPATAPTTAQRPTLGERLLINSYVGLHIGGITYPFSGAQLQPGFQVQSVATPPLAVRVIIYGHQFNKYFSAQISEMRPVEWVLYKNVNGDNFAHSVWMNIGGLTGKGSLPITRKISLFGEAGLGIVTRTGFSIGPGPAVTGASYSTILFGGGAEYALNDRWSLLASVVALPGNSGDKQPHSIFFSAGFDYTLRRLPSKVLAAGSGNSDEGQKIWPKNILQVGYINDAVGFGVNNAVIKAKIFWPGNVYVGNGVSVSFERNILHTRRWFALDWGAEISTWSSKLDHQRFYTAALYPVLRFPLVRTNPVEFYFSYSLAGPTLITRTELDDQKTGRNFTFQDYMSLGFYFGKKRKVAADFRVTHYSNGNVFPQNPGITVPLGFYVGTTF
jgi:hypothetical protein